MRRLGLVLAVVVACAGCVVPLDPPPAGSPDAAGAPARGGVLRLAASEEPRTLDPALGYDTVSWLYELALFNMLVDYDDGTTIVPSLAASWTVSPDGRVYRFTLRTDVRFSTGRAFTADDVRYSLERVLRPSLHSQGAEFFSALDGADAYVAAPEGQGHVAGIVVDDPHTVSLRLTAPDPLFLHKLTMPFAAVVDRETVERVGDKDFQRQPVGTGPFRLAEWQYGQELRLERNPHYFREGLPYLDGLDVTIGVSDQLAWFKYQRGEIDVAGIPSAEFARVLADTRYQPLLLQRTTLRTQYLGMNCALPPFDRREVRQAFNYAVDTGRLLELADGRGVVARTVLPPDMPGYRRADAGYRHDPARARALLAGAGRIDTTLWSGSDDGSLRLAQSIQRDLGDVGVAARIKPVTFPALIEAIRNPGQVPLFVLGWEADFPDPSNFLTVLLHGRNRGTNNNTFFDDPTVNALLDRGDASIEPRARQRIFQRAERRILDAAPWVPLFHPVSFAVRNPRVHDYRLHPLRPSRFEQVWVAG